MSGRGSGDEVVCFLVYFCCDLRPNPLVLDEALFWGLRNDRHLHVLARPREQNQRLRFLALTPDVFVLHIFFAETEIDKAYCYYIKENRPIHYAIRNTFFLCSILNMNKKYLDSSAVYERAACRCVAKGDSHAAAQMYEQGAVFSERALKFF